MLTQTTLDRRRMPWGVGRLCTARFHRDGVLTLELFGSVSMSTQRLLREELDQVLQEGHRHLELDLRGLDCFGSAGVTSLIQAHKRLRRRGGKLWVQAPEWLRRQLALLGLTELVADPVIA